MRKFHFGNAILFLLVWALFVLTGFAVVCCAPSANGQTPTIPGLPRMVELSPVKEKAAPVTPPADSPTVDINKYRVFALKDSAGKEWAGPVTWEIEGDSLGFKEAAKPLTLFGVIQGQNEPTENDVPVGGVVIWGKQDGVTKLVAYGVVDNKAKKLFSRTFTVGQMPQPPPGPVTPVDPVKPILTPFQQTLATAIKADGAIPAHVTLYAALWRTAAIQTVNDPTITTGAALLAEMQTAVKLLGLPPGSLRTTARCIADKLNTSLSKTGKLNADSRAEISSLFSSLAEDLDAAGGAK